MEPSVFKSVLGDLVSFSDRYARLFGRPQNQKHALAYLRGLLGPADRKSVEPIALEEESTVRTLQHFIGQGRWRDERVLREHQRHVSETLGQSEGIVIFDGSGFPKQGEHSVGVARQWCGNLGKEANCQVGIFLGYASDRGHTLLDRRLYLPRDWAEDARRRIDCHVPDIVSFKTNWELAWEMYQEVRRSGVPHAWVTGDEDFGKVHALGDLLHAYGQPYVFEVASSAVVYGQPPRFRKAFRRIGYPTGKPAALGAPRPQSVADLAGALEASEWKRFRIRDGEKGPLEVEAVRLQVWLSRDQLPGRPAWLVATRGAGPDPERKYFLAECGWTRSLGQILRAAFSRWSIEQCFEQGKQELGMDQYETRSWAGWHHHMTMVILAHHFLVLERGRRGKKGGRTDGRGTCEGHARALGAGGGSAGTAMPEDPIPDPGAPASQSLPLPSAASESSCPSPPQYRLTVPDVA